MKDAQQKLRRIERELDEERIATSTLGVIMAKYSLDLNPNSADFYSLAGDLSSASAGWQEEMAVQTYPSPMGPFRWNLPSSFGCFWLAIVAEIYVVWQLG
ncbi:uncharacterized protein VTP21DRAFT_7481 [Calcarisporiella thermophila]|uniref:uncharacterized protein n=1 Tax=Calcarisporiella thermophila TaxID=911321 RepID=UPI003741EA2F